MGARIDYTGTVRLMNNGQYAEVIKYISSKDMTIRFEDGIKSSVRKGARQNKVLKGLGITKRR